MRRGRVFEEDDPEFGRPHIRVRDWSDADEAAFQRQHTVPMVKLRSKTLRTPQPISGIEYAYTTSDNFDEQTPTGFHVTPARVINSFASRAGSELKFYDCWIRETSATGGAKQTGEQLLSLNGNSYKSDFHAAPNAVTVNRFLLNSIRSGSSASEREGRSVHFTSIQVNYSFLLEPKAGHERHIGGYLGDLYIVRDHQYAGTPPLVTDIFYNEPSTVFPSTFVFRPERMRNLARVTRFSILAHSRLLGSSIYESTGVEARAMIIDGSLAAKLDFDCDYDATSVDDSGLLPDTALTRNGIFLVMCPVISVGVDMLPFIIHSRLRYRG